MIARSGSDRRPGYPATYSLDTQTVLHLLQRYALGLRVILQNQEEIDHHHGGKKYEGVSAGRARHDGKYEQDDCVRHPVGRTAERLPLRAHAVRKYLADIDPDHSTLRYGETGDICHE